MPYSEWSDWQDSEGTLIFCLFCQASSQDLSSTLEHMRASHGFDYHHTCRQLNLDYYGQVKIINYIRRQVSVACGWLMIGPPVDSAHRELSNEYQCEGCGMDDRPTNWTRLTESSPMSTNVRGVA